MIAIIRLCLCLLLPASHGSFSQASQIVDSIHRHIAADTTEAEKVSQVRVTVHTIDRSLASYEKVVKENVPGESLEGNVISFYMLDSQVRKIAAVFYGETYKLSEEYYFDDHALVFYYAKREQYNMPLGAADLKVASVIETRYYFFDGEIFLVKLKPELQSAVDMKKLTEDTYKEARRLIKLK